MYFRKFIIALSFLTFVLQLSVNAQLRDSIPLNTIITKAIKYANDRPIEKVYLHTDKPYYAVGDSIWLKAYVTLDLHQASALSKIVYVDLFTSQDSLMETLKLPVKDGVAAGKFVLSQTSYKQGNYRLRAYTNWMLNFDPVYLFNKTITIGSPVDNPVSTNISFDYGAKGSQARVNAKINYHDNDDKPLADKKLTWRVEVDGDVTSKGKGSTDASGNLVINFPPAQLANLSSGTLFTVIDLGNRKYITNSFPLRSATPDVDVQFFAEGGSFIEGIRNRVAFKALKSNGLGIDIKGTIVDNEGKAVANFESQHLGMGVFALIPEPGKTYKANITLSDGSQTTAELPKVRVGGINLSVANLDPENLTIKLQSSDAFFKANQGKTLYIVAQSGGFIKFAAQTPLTSTVYAATIPKSKFQTGILQLTLFSSTGDPLSERIVFIKRNDLLNLNVTTDAKTYRQRGKVKMTVSARAKALPVASNLSISVVDESKVPVNENTETTILTSILLTSDLRGYIEQPNYYFNHQDDKTASDLDILMLTQGYRRFVYKDIIGDKPPHITLLPEQGIDISGILRTKTGMPVFKGNVRLIVADKNSNSAEAITDANGVFKFTNVMVLDSSKVTVTARNNVNSNNLVVTLDGIKYPNVTRNVNLPDEVLNIDSALKPYLINSKKQYANSRLLKEVIITAPTAEKKPSHVDYPALTGLNMEADHMITGDRFKGCNDFISCLRTMAMGLTFDDNNFYVTRDWQQGNKTPVQVFLNGMAVDVFALSGTSPGEIESVEIFLKDGLSGINRRFSTNGVLVVNTKKIAKSNIKLSDLQKLFPPAYIISFMPKGYNIAREFYVPKYDPAKSSTLGVDLRTTVYWNPTLLTDKTTGNASVEYFNADGRGSYRAVVEGIDAEGNIGRYVYRYKVE